jgi:di/tricarboxylate transporter
VAKHGAYKRFQYSWQLLLRFYLPTTRRTTSFLTPVGHHGNLLVYGPGGYQFTDFIRAGAPLTLLIAVVVVVMVQIIWPS